jgi:hypothetical protein
MKFEDVKIGDKVVPHKKSVGISYENWSDNINYNNYKFYLENKYLFVSKLVDSDCFMLCRNKDGYGDYFNASDFTPYEPKKQNPPYSHLQARLKAYCKLNGVDADKVFELLFAQPVEPKEDKPTFEVGEWVRVNPNFKGNTYGISADDILKFSKKPHKIEFLHFPKHEWSYAKFTNSLIFWNLEMLSKIPQPTKHTVIVDGENYVEEKEN